MRLAVFSDAHIGSYGRKIDEETGLNARLLDTVQSLKFVISDAKERGAEEIYFGGDMFRNAKPSPTELVLTRNALSLATGSLIYMIEGNHDLPRHTGECSALMPLTGGEVGICSAPEVWDVRDYQVAFLPYPNRARLAEVFVDYAHLSPEESDRLVSAHVETILRGLAAQLDSTRPSLLLAHISIDAAEAGAEGSIMAGRDITIPLSAVPEEFTFAAFGHIHKPQDFSAYGRPNVFYTGSTDRIDFGEEGEEKSYVMIDFEERSWSRIPIPCRKYKTFEFWGGNDGRVQDSANENMG